jgi:hypothetical protein
MYYNGHIQVNKYTEISSRCDKIKDSSPTRHLIYSSPANVISEVISSLICLELYMRTTRLKGQKDEIACCVYCYGELILFF